MLSTLNRVWKVVACTTVVVFVLAGCSNANPQAGDTSEPTIVSTNTPEAVATETPTQASATTATENNQASGNSQTFIIDPSQSQARYNIFEELMGSPKTVVGVTNGVEGSVTLDPADLSSATISPIQIDARTFATDSSRRDGAVRRFVLGSDNDSYRYITFTPTQITGLPASAKVGESINFEVAGDMKIYETTKPITFAMTVTAASDVEITGSGTTTILRSDFGLTIPSVPSVANVADEVPLFIDFVAKTQ